MIRRISHHQSYAEDVPSSSVPLLRVTCTMLWASGSSVTRDVSCGDVVVGGGAAVEVVAPTVVVVVAFTAEVVLVVVASVGASVGASEGESVGASLGESEGALLQID